MNDIKIKVKKSELEYCFKADNYDEFHRRFNQLADIMYQRFINELTKEQLKKAMVNNIYGYIDTDLTYAECKQKISSVYGVCCKDNTTKTKINKRFGIAMREELKMNMKIETANKIDLQGFLTELGKLSKRYGIVIGGCGCCGSPYLDYMDGNTRVTASDLAYEQGAYEVAIEGYKVIVRGVNSEIHK